MNQLQSLETPLLLLDAQKMQANIQRMQDRMNMLGVAFRPHVKTSKCQEVVQQQLKAGACGITVSTLKEAEAFFHQGFTDILYAVALAPNKIEHAFQLIKAGLHLTLLVESVSAAALLSQHGRANNVCYDVLIEIDTDHHRSGIEPQDPLLLDVAAALTNNGKAGAHLKGVMTHAGSSYDLNTPEALEALAEQERALCVLGAENLRKAGYALDVVSVGSTPTALSAKTLQGVTEVRAGVYVFFDLVMAGIGICQRNEIALSVLCTVIGHRPSAGWIITDAGWMAMSRDRGTQKQAHDYGYGQVCDIDGIEIPDMVFEQANQEHGVIAWTGSPTVDIVQRFPIGSFLRVLPNHACATGAQHEKYWVIPADGDALLIWDRFGGW